MPAAAENARHRRGPVAIDRGRVHIRLEKSVLEMLERRAQEADITPAALARNLIASGLLAMPKGKPKRGRRTPSA